MIELSKESKEALANLLLLAYNKGERSNFIGYLAVQAIERFNKLDIEEGLVNDPQFVTN